MDGRMRFLDTENVALLKAITKKFNFLTGFLLVKSCKCLAVPRAHNDRLWLRFEGREDITRTATLLQHQRRWGLVQEGVEPELEGRVWRDWFRTAS